MPTIWVEGAALDDIAEEGNVAAIVAVHDFADAEQYAHISEMVLRDKRITKLESMLESAQDALAKAESALNRVLHGRHPSLMDKFTP